MGFLVDQINYYPEFLVRIQEFTLYFDNSCYLRVVSVQNDGLDKSSRGTPIVSGMERAVSQTPFTNRTVSG